jgi:hypothetical protein
MPVTLTYNGENEEVKRAVALANDVLQGDRLLEILRGRTKPFADCTPKELLPERIATYFQNATLALRVVTYRTSKTIGGYFIPSKPTTIHVNLNNLPRRPDCSTAAMIVHECVHALSYEVSRYEKVAFSHTGPRDGNDDTAPYWIQTQIRAELCKAPVTNDNIEVAVFTSEKEAAQLLGEENFLA